MPFPVGRVGTKEFLRLTGLSKTRFFVVYRPDPFWVERFDIRQDSSGRLNMSEAAALRFARGRKGDRAVDRSPRAEALFRECPHCAEEIRVRAKICKHCGRDVAPPDDE